MRSKERREGEGAEAEIYGPLSRSVGTTLRHPEPRDSRTQLFEWITFTYIPEINIVNKIRADHHPVAEGCVLLVPPAAQ